MTRKQEIEKKYWGDLTPEQKKEMENLRRSSRKGWVKVESVSRTPHGASQRTLNSDKKLETKVFVAEFSNNN
jgi:hypothetical protein